MPAEAANLHQKTLEALLDAYVRGEGLTGHDIAVRIGKAGVPDHISKLRKYGYRIKNVLRAGKHVYVLETALPDQPEALPNLPMPSRAVIDTQRAIDGVPAGVCDFCLSPERSTASLQREHGHPARYFGTSEDTRWLLACAPCNTRKRSACDTCPNRDPQLRDRARCDGCLWGNPHSADVSHTAGRALIVFPVSCLGQRAMSVLRERALASGESVEHALAEVLGVELPPSNRAVAGPGRCGHEVLGFTGACDRDC